MPHRTDSLKSFIVLIQALGLLLAIVGSFFGGLYLFNGSILFALPLSLLLVVAMFRLVTYFMKEKQELRRKGYPPMFYVLFCLYGLLGIVLSFLVLHFVNVEFFEKNEIKSNARIKLDGLEKIYQEYNQEYENFCSVLSSDIILRTSTQDLVDANRSVLNGAPYNLDDNTLKIIFKRPDRVGAINDIKIQPMKDDFKATELALMSNKNEFFSSSLLVIDEWSRLKIAKVFNDIHRRVANDYLELNNKLISKSSNRVQLITNQQSLLQNSLIDKPFQLAIKHLGLTTVIVLIVFQLLILLPYFLTKGRQY
jgi:hypothetical protein